MRSERCEGASSLRCQRRRRHRRRLDRSQGGIFFAELMLSFCEFVMVCDKDLIFVDEKGWHILVGR